MDQSRALNALEPFLALAKSATSPRAASDLITQATSAPNTYVFAELLQHPNIHALENHEQYGGHFKLLETFAWGTWESYQAASSDSNSTPLPTLSDSQARKLRLLSLLSIASEKPSTQTQQHHLSYPTLLARLSLPSPLDLEQLVTSAIYDNLLTATLNPTSQTVVITSVAPLRDLAPGSVAQLLSELSAWSGRCDAVLADLQAEVKAIEDNAGKRAKREGRTERQVKAAGEAGEKFGSAGVRTGRKVEGAEEEGDAGDAMEVDEDVSPTTAKSAGGSVGGGKKRSTGGGSGKVAGGKQGR